jgi:ABC-2 type transport system ATP-binding protein
VKFYSSGMYVRLAFAVAVHVDPDVLLVDEVLAVGDEPFQRKCMDRIKGFQREGRTIIFVTHGLDVVRQLCDRVIMLEKGNVIVDGTPVDALRAFRERYADETAADPDEFGTRRVQITNTTITDGHGNAKDRFEPGEELGVELRIRANEPTDDWAAGIAIYNHLDVLIYGTNTVLRGDALPPIDHEATLAFGFGALPMVEGQYYVTVAVHSKDETQQYHRQERIAAFRVLSPPSEVGVLHMNTTFDIELQ